MALSDTEIKSIIETIETNLGQGLEAAHGLRYLLKMRSTMGDETVLTRLLNHYRGILDSCSQNVIDALLLFGSR